MSDKPSIPLSEMREMGEIGETNPLLSSDQPTGHPTDKMTAVGGVGALVYAIIRALADYDIIIKDGTSALIVLVVGWLAGYLTRERG